MRQDYGTTTTAMFDHGAKIGIAVERNGVRRTLRFDNPFADEINAEWHETHRCSLPGCQYCEPRQAA